MQSAAHASLNINQTSTNQAPNINDIIKSEPDLYHIREKLSDAYLTYNAKGVDEELADEEGRTPLINAIIYKKHAALNWLLSESDHPKHVINFYKKDKSNRDALDYLIDQFDVSEEKPNPALDQILNYFPFDLVKSKILNLKDINKFNFMLTKICDYTKKQEIMSIKIKNICASIDFPMQAKLRISEILKILEANKLSAEDLLKVNINLRITVLGVKRTCILTLYELVTYYYQKNIFQTLRGDSFPYELYRVRLALLLACKDGRITVDECIKSLPKLGEKGQHSVDELAIALHIQDIKLLKHLVLIDQADIHARFVDTHNSFNQQSYFQIAIEWKKGNAEILDFLLSHAKSFVKENSDLLHEAVQHSNLDCLKVLLNWYLPSSKEIEKAALAKSKNQNSESADRIYQLVSIWRQFNNIQNSTRKIFSGAEKTLKNIKERFLKLNPIDQTFFDSLANETLSAVKAKQSWDQFLTSINFVEVEEVKAEEKVYSYPPLMQNNNNNAIHENENSNQYINHAIHAASPKKQVQNNNNALAEIEADPLDFHNDVSSESDLETDDNLEGNKNLPEPEIKDKPIEAENIPEEIPSPISKNSLSSVMSPGAISKNGEADEKIEISQEGLPNPPNTIIPQSEVPVANTPFNLFQNAGLPNSVSISLKRRKLENVLLCCDNETWANNPTLRQANIAYALNELKRLDELEQFENKPQNRK